MTSEIAVVGPIPRDTITTHEGKIIKKYGGITNPVIALSHLLEEEGKVNCISNIRIKDKQPIIDIFSPYSNIDVSGLNDEEDKGTVIQLKFLDQNRRVEKQTACMNPILPKHVEPYLHSDVFVFVPITDFEVSIETLKFIKEKSDSIIIFDAHGPTNCMSIDGNRHQKFWVDRDVWLPYIDVLKMNLEEAHCCWFKTEYDLSELDNHSESEDFLDEFGAHVLSQGTKVLYVTLDSRGCVAYKKVDGEVQKEFIKSVPVEQVIDTTGCGDSFAAGLAYGYMKNPSDMVYAAFFANAMGALRTQGTTFEVFKPLDYTEKLIEHTYDVSL